MLLSWRARNKAALGASSIAFFVVGRGSGSLWIVRSKCAHRATGVDLPEREFAVRSSPVADVHAAEEPADLPASRRYRV